MAGWVTVSWRLLGGTSDNFRTPGSFASFAERGVWYRTYVRIRCEWSSSPIMLDGSFRPSVLMVRGCGGCVVSICDVTESRACDGRVCDGRVCDAVGDAVGGFAGLCGDQRHLAFMSVEREIPRLQAVQAGMVCQVKLSLSFLDDRHHSPVRWVQAVTNCSRGTATRVTVAAALQDQLPVFAAAVSAGEIGGDQVRLMPGLYTKPKSHHAHPTHHDLHS